MKNKTAQFTSLDKALLPSVSHRFEGEQKPLPFKGYELYNDILRSKEPKPAIPTEPLSIKYPELQPEQLGYKNLTEKQLQRLRDEDDENYKRHLSNWWQKDKPFEPENKRYYELNAALPEEAKKKIIEKYNELRAASSKFMESYNEANKMAAQELVFSYEGTYFDLFKNFGRYVVAALTRGIGSLFGIVSEKARYGRYTAFEARSRNLTKILTEGLNLFNITPLNFETKLHEMDTAIYSMNGIMDEFERRKKLLKKLPQEVNDGVKRYLLKKDTRIFLKWLDEYFPNDKKDFVDGMLQDVLSGGSTSVSGTSVSVGDLKKIKSYSSIYYKSRMHATHNLFYSLERKTIHEMEKRFFDEMAKRISPKVNYFITFINELGEISGSPEKIKQLINFIYKNYNLDLRSVLQFVKTNFSQKYEETAQPDKIENKYNEFIGNFKEVLLMLLKEIPSKLESSWTRDEFVSDIFKIKDKEGKIDYEKLSKTTEKELNDMANKYIRNQIINSLPNFKSNRRYQSNEYNYPNFSGVGKMLNETGKFSIDATVNFVHSKVSFVPKEFIVNLVKTLFRGQYKTDENIIKMSPNKAFSELSNIVGAYNRIAMKALLDLLKRTNKLNPDSFTNVFLQSFDDLQYIVNRLGAELDKKKPSDEDMVKIISLIIRNQDTIDRDKETADKFTLFLHNSAGNLNIKDIIKILENKNFAAYTKVGISKKLINAYAILKNVGGVAGLIKKYGPVLEQMKNNGFISKNFERNVNFIIRTFNSGEAIIPSDPIFKKLFEATSAIETDMQALEMTETFKDLIINYKKKDERLFRLDENINDRLRFRVLKDRDPRMLRVGIESNCCQRIGGAGEVAARDSFVNRLAGVLLLEWKNKTGEWVLLTQSYFHYVPEKNGYILDNIEYNSSNVDESGVDLAAAYGYLARMTKQKFDISYFLSGKGYSKVNTRSFKTHKLRGGDPRYFDRSALTENNRSFYSDFKPSDSMDLLNPNFDLDKKIPELTGMIEKVREAFEIVLPRIIRTAIVA